MPEKSQDTAETDITTFVTANYYIVGVGDTVDEAQATGEWVATENPVDVHP